MKISPSTKIYRTFHFMQVFVMKFVYSLHLTSYLIFQYNIKVKGSQLDAVSQLAIGYCYLEFKLSYLKNLKLFSIRVKELSEPIVL